jgi:hypothetical protein
MSGWNGAPQPVWHYRLNMVCDRTVTLAFGAVPDGGTHDGG